MATYDSALQRALAGASDLQAGTWESVEAMALLAVETQDTRFLETAQGAARGLKGQGSWQAVRALAFLARAERLLG